MTPPKPPTPSDIWGNLNGQTLSMDQALYFKYESIKYYSHLWLMACDFCLGASVTMCVWTYIARWGLGLSLPLYIGMIGCAIAMGVLAIFAMFRKAHYDQQARLVWGNPPLEKYDGR